LLFVVIDWVVEMAELVVVASYFEHFASYAVAFSFQLFVVFAFSLILVLMSL
jgi:hypothetical protein